MNDELLGERKRVLEEEYFRNSNAQLVERLRSARQKEDARLALRDVSGISDPTLLDRLIGVGIDPATLSVLEVIPLVAVAWADGQLEDEERKAVLESAAAVGLSKGSEGHILLDDWLTRQPAPAVLAAWEGYVRALSGSLDRETFQALGTETLMRARAAAEARGGFLGLGSRVSAPEQAVLDLIERSFAP